MAKAVLPPIQRPMDETVEARLCTVYRVETGDQLPAAVRDAYSNLKVASERLGSSTNSDAFLFGIIITSGVPVPVAEVTFLDYIRQGLVGHEESLMVKYRTKWEPATYLGFQGGMVKVDMGGTERSLDPELVKFAEDAVTA